MNNKFAWNQVYKVVMFIKQDYQVTFGDGETNFEVWLEKLNNDVWNSFFKCLQTTQYNNLLLVRYGLHDMERGMWDGENSIYRECRSIVIDLEYEEIVLLPFKKFFNLNEVEENSQDKIIEEIANAKTFEITDKLDGSMQSARYYRGQIIMSGSRALDITKSWRLKDGYSMLTDNHKRMLKDFTHLTFIFEYISLKDAHVVKYKKSDEGLYLIGIRNVYTGEEFEYELIKSFAKQYGIRTVITENLTFEELMGKVSTVSCTEKEGWVLNINGHKVKIKCDDYVQLHKMLDHVSSINVILENVANGTVDDLMSKIRTDYRPRVVGIIKLIQDRVNEIQDQVIYWFEKNPYESDKKGSMIWIMDNVPKEYRGMVIRHYLGKPYNILKNRCGDTRKASDIGLDSILCKEYSAIFGGNDENGK